MLETLADFDDDLMEMLLEDQEPPADHILRDLRKTLGADQVVPVFMGVAEQDMGVRRLLEALAKEAPEPGVDRGAGRRRCRRRRPLVQVLKNYHLPHAGKLSLARVWRGDGQGRHDAGRHAGRRRLPACSAASSRTSARPRPARSSASAGWRAPAPAQTLSNGAGRGGDCRPPRRTPADVRVRASPPPTATTRSSSRARSPS